MPQRVFIPLPASTRDNRGAVDSALGVDSADMRFSICLHWPGSHLLTVASAVFLEL